MKALINLPLLFTVMVFFTSCVPILYSTMPHNTPLPEKKHDIDFSGGLASSTSVFSSALGLNVMTSYAFSEDFFVSANYLTWGGDSQEESLNNNQLLKTWESKAQIVELGIGKFWVHQKDKRLRSEVTLGSGYASINNLNHDLSFVEAKYMNFFVQPAVGFKSEYFWLSTSLKTCYINYLSLDWDLKKNNFEQRLSTFYASNKSKLCLEPGVSAGLHLKHITLSTKYSVSTFNTNEFGDTILPMAMNRIFLFSMAANFNVKRSK
jgi:hypothetical protein